MKNEKIRAAGRLFGTAAVVVFAGMAQAAPSPTAGPPAKNPAVTLEPIAGTNVKRVILTAKAAERLGIATTPVQEQPIARRQMVGGLIIAAAENAPEVKPAAGFGAAGAPANGPATGAPGGFTQRASASASGGGFAGFVVQNADAKAQPLAQGQSATTAPAAQAALKPMPGSAWVSVTLTPGEWERVAKDKPARILPLSTREALKKDVLAQPAGMPPREDVRRSMLTVYYTLPGQDHGLALNQRMRVELPLSGSDEKHRVVPYSAVYYDAKGSAWVYLTPKPYVYERQLVQVGRVAGDVAVISDGPPVGAHVVSTGAALLYGAEIFGK